MMYLHEITRSKRFAPEVDIPYTSNIKLNED